MAQTPTPHTANDDAPIPASDLSTGRRSLMRAAAWSVPVVAVASSAPAFAGSGGATPSTLVATPHLFWRPTSAEASSFGEGSYWVFIPEATILGIVTLTNTGAAMTSRVEMTVEVTVDSSTTKNFQILDAGGLVTVPAVNALTARPANGRVVISTPPLGAGETKTVTIAFTAPTTLSRSSAVSWNVTVLPGSGSATSVPITTYTQFRAGL